MPHPIDDISFVGWIAKNVPLEKHAWFLVDFRAHNASYLGGFVGGIMLVVWAWWSRCAGGLC